MLTDTLNFLITNLFGFFILNLLLRFYLQLVRAPFHHPLAQFVVKLTNFIVLPTRRLLPSVGPYDSATLLLSFLAAMLMQLGLLLLMPLPINPLSPAFALGLSLLALLTLLKLSLYLLFGAVLVQAILSWVNPYNPLSPLLDKISRPMLAPIRKIIPTIGGIDLSPFVLLLAVQLVQGVLISRTERALIQYIFFG